MFLVNSRLGRFCATPSRPAGAQPVDEPGSPFSRSYRVKLPSSLAKVLPCTWAVFCQPTSVGLRYGRAPPIARGFSWRSGLDDFRPHRCGPPPAPQAWPGWICLPGRPTRRRAPCPVGGARLPLRVPPSLVAVSARCRNVDLLSIDYALRPRLRPDYPWEDHPAPGTLGLAVCRILAGI